MLDLAFGFGAWAKFGAELEHRIKCHTCCTGEGVHHEMCSHVGNFINRIRKEDRKLSGEIWVLRPAEPRQQTTLCTAFLTQWDKYSCILQSSRDGANRAHSTRPLHSLLNRAGWLLPPLDAAQGCCSGWLSCNEMFMVLVIRHRGF